ncbi:MAG: sulfatase-like hydrolase/transferase, partial [Myxococcota bacterium]
VGVWWSRRPPEPLVTAHPARDAPRPPPATGPNLVLVIGCTIRRDQTTPYGGPADTTPVLAGFARDGARFGDLVTAAPWTRAASTAILTGFHPLSIGMAEPGPGRDELALPPRVTTLAEHLRSAGWSTIGLTTNPNLNAVYGFDQGFDAYRQLAQLWRDAAIKVPGALAVDDAMALLDDAPTDRPFYLQLMLIDAHAPFTTTEAERAAHRDPTVPPVVVDYRVGLRRWDQALGALDRALADRGFDASNTVLAVANDHGDGLGWPIHHGRSHGRFLAPSSVGGVFVVRGPGIPPGRTIGGVASQVDIAPTLAGLIGAPAFPSPGIDASAAIRGASDALDRDRAFTDTWFKDTDRTAVYTATTACQLDLSGAPPGPSWRDGCFDRATDPLHGRPHRDPALEDALRAWRVERTAEARAFGPVERVTPDASTAAQLEALGYTE